MRLLYANTTAGSVPGATHGGALVEPPETVYDRLALPEAPSDRPLVAVNMAATLDGKITLGLGGSEQKLGSRVDRDVMFRLRYHFDAVVRGAETVRRGPWYPRVPTDLAEARQERGLSRHPLAVVITSSCALPLGREFFTYVEAPGPVVVITTQSAPEEALRAVEDVALVRVAGRERVDVAAALHILATEFGVWRLLSEGGARLNWDFMQAGCLDELFCTVTPKVSGCRGDVPLVRGPHLLDPVPTLELVSLYHHGGELYERWKVRKR